MSYSFLLPVFCLLYAFLPLWLGGLVPVHDGMNVYGLFHYFYTQFLAYGHLAQWAPYDFYGQPAYFAQIVSLSPLSYLAMAAGKVLHIMDTLFLFKAVMALEVLVFSLGLWQWGRRVYQSSLAAGMLVVWGTLTATWITQPFYDFRIFYVWPWVLLSLVDFAETRTLRSLAWAGLWLLAQLLGNLAYFCGLWFLAAVVFTGAVLAAGGGWKGFKISTQGAWWLLGCAGVAVLFLLYMKGLFHGLALVTPDRMSDASTSLQEFLTYGDAARFWPWLSSTLGFGPIFLWGLHDITPFVGVATFFLCLWSFVTAASPAARGAQAVLVVLVAMVFIPWVAKALYFFPLVKYYRPLALLPGFAKFFILVCAGFGWDDLARRLSGQRRRWLITVIAVAALEMAVHQERLWQEIITINPQVPELKMLVTAVPMPWQEKRTDQPDTPRQRAAWTLMQKAALNGGRYTTDYDFVEWDDCNTAWRRNLAVSGVHELESINPGFLGVLGGCRGPKLRLVPKAVTLSKEDYEKLLTWMDEQMDATLQQFPQDTMQVLVRLNQRLHSFIDVPQGTALPPQQPDSVSGNLRVAAFNSDRLLVEATSLSQPGLWLFYGDGYHPGWKADIDGKPAPVVNADIAFKAVWVPGGDHKVEFFFSNGLQTILSYLLMAFGCLMGLVMLGQLRPWNMERRKA